MSRNEIEEAATRLVLDALASAPRVTPHLADAGLPAPVSASFAVLTDEDKVTHDPCTRALCVDPGYLDLLLASRGSASHVVMLAALHAVHETIHLPQGIADKTTVRELRQVGAEAGLLRLGLASDHDAASLIAAARPTWTVVQLKQLQVTALADFPVTVDHDGESRHRKARRLVSLCCDVIGRAGGAWSALSGFIEAEFGGGCFVLFEHGACIRRLGSTPVSASDAVFLEAAADGARQDARHARRLDRLLHTLLTRALAPPNRRAG